ncbi:helix-turn-helix domain-containing protein [Streptacidiphilus cavernicola]|uniref:Helix-turn-helix domain-containing protein n=1 Tax=Streptacidiphilus cavernicola TaxID=3342716 RepID=A0ABV6VZL2_9ACTN
MSESRGSVPVVGLRIVDDIDTLKALADPIRVTILQVMMGRTGQDPRGWTAKELAAELDQPQTKLYRHIKHLEERGLLRVAETRLVSGITEQRYVAAQTDLQLSRELLGGEIDADDVAAAFGAAIGSYRDRFLTAVRSGGVRMNPGADAESHRKPLMMLGDVRLAPGRADEFHDRLAGLMAEYLQGPEQDDGIPVNVMLAVYCEDGPTGG